MVIDWYVVGIFAVAIGIFVLSFSINNLRIRLKDSIYLTIAAISAEIFGISALLMVYYQINNSDLFILFSKIAMLPLLTIFIMGYFYYESFVSMSPPLSRLIPMISFFIFALTMNLLSLFGILGNLTLLAFAVSITFFFGTTFHIFALTVYRKILQIWNKLAVKLDFFSLLFIGTSTLFFGIGFSLDPNAIINLNFSQLTILGVGMALIIIGMGFLIFNNVKWGDYIFYIPFPIYQIMIYSPGGLLYYSRNVHAKSAENVLQKDEYLISGALSAFSTFFKESLGIGAVLSHINATAYDFFFMDLPKESGTLVVLTSGANAFINRSLLRFKKALTPTILEKVKEFSGREHQSDEIDEIVTKAFPYLVISKSNNIESNE